MDLNEQKATSSSTEENKNENELEMKFNKVNLNEIKNKMSKLPLKPCLRCQTFVNYETHNQSECALFQHEKLRETSSEEEKEEKNPNWRKTDPSEKRGRESFQTNDKRKKRQDMRRTIKNLCEQQIIHAEKNAKFTRPQYNVWNIPEQINHYIEYPLSTPKPKRNELSNIINFLNRPKKRTICIEGNIGAGKTTILNAINELGNPDVLTLREPLNKWKNIHDINLLQLMYDNPTKWAATFQSFALLSLAKNHLNPGGIKFIERSIYSAKYVFMECNKMNGNIDEPNWAILNNWFDFILTNTKVKTDAIIYIRTTPKTAYERMKKRSRPEEEKISKQYIKEIHEQYDNWLVKGKYTWPCQIIILNGDKKREEILHDLNEEICLIP